MAGLSVNAYSKKYGWYTNILPLPEWWIEWDSIILEDMDSRHRIVEIKRGNIEDRFASLERKIDQLITLLESKT